jgi:hypothetical protein
MNSPNAIEVKEKPGRAWQPEVIAFMDHCGFAMYDIASFVRPYRGELVQVDLLYATRLQIARWFFSASRSGLPC